MKYDIPIRIRVLRPFAGITMKVQRGRDELLPPTSNSEKELLFDLKINVDLSSGPPNFLGTYAQGPKDARFIYVNSGKYAGQPDTECARRAKISLMSISKKQIEEIIASTDKLLEVSFNGTGSDGWPTCATVKGIEWKVVKK